VLNLKDFIDKVAVITGAASGIGRALADRCAREGMSIVLADVEIPALLKAETELKATGIKILAIKTDVSKANDVETLAEKTLETFGEVHLLVNNAGVGVVGTIWETTLADWNWVLGVNLWGVIHGVRVFVPIMLEQETEGYIVNTAAMAGFQSRPNNGIYNISKHGVVTLSETLYHELKQRDAQIKVSVLCPGPVITRFMEGERNRPIELQNPLRTTQKSSAAEQLENTLHQVVQAGMPPQQIANEVFKAIQEEKFYILTHLPRYRDILQTRLEDILQGRNPTLPDPIRTK